MSRRPHPSPPVLWHELIVEADALTARTGGGLAGLWALIHSSDYRAARRRLDALLEELTP